MASDWQTWQARREGWTTYVAAPVVYTAAAVAGLLVMLTPVFVRLIMGLVVVLSQIFEPGGVQWGGPAVYGNYLFAKAYVKMLWPFLLIAMVTGLLLGALRRKRGFRFRQIPWRPYEARLRLPLPPHTLIMYCLGPLLLYAVAAYADRRVYVRLLTANFMLWAASGVLAKVLWEAWLDLLLVAGARLGAWPRPARKLDAEYELRRLLELDPMLSGLRLQDVVVDESGAARVVGDLTPEEQRRVAEMIKQHLPGITRMEIVTERMPEQAHVPVA